VLSTVVAPLPRVLLFQDLAVAGFTDAAVNWAEAGNAIVGAALFTASFLVLGVLLLARKDL
jgi:hypothetical protein